MHQLEAAGDLETVGKLHLCDFIGSFLLKYANEALTSFLVKGPSLPHKPPSPRGVHRVNVSDKGARDVKYERVGPCLVDISAGFTGCRAAVGPVPSPCREQVPAVPRWDCALPGGSSVWKMFIFFVIVS